MLSFPLHHTLAVALTLLALAGCTTPVATGAAASGSASSAQEGVVFGHNGDGSAGGAMGGPGGPGGMGGGLASFLTSLALSAEQKTQLEAIAAQQRPAPGDMPAEQPTLVDLEALLTAETLDAAAVRAAITAQQTNRPAGGPDMAAEAQAFYAVLTPAQRTQLAAALKAQSAPTGGQPPQGEMPAIDTTQAGLTAEQQALFDTWQAEANGLRGGQTDRAAIATYFETGDASGLSAGASASATYPVDALLALATSLSADQRLLLFTQGVPGLPGAPGGMPRP